MTSRGPDEAPEADEGINQGIDQGIDAVGNLIVVGAEIWRAGAIGSSGTSAPESRDARVREEPIESPPIPIFSPPSSSPPSSSPPSSSSVRDDAKIAGLREEIARLRGEIFIVDDGDEDDRGEEDPDESSVVYANFRLRAQDFERIDDPRSPLIAWPGAFAAWTRQGISLADLTKNRRLEPDDFCPILVRARIGVVPAELLLAKGERWLLAVEDGCDLRGAPDEDAHEEGCMCHLWEPTHDRWTRTSVDGIPVDLAAGSCVVGTLRGPAPPWAGARVWILDREPSVLAGLRIYASPRLHRKLAGIRVGSTIEIRTHAPAPAPASGRRGRARAASERRHDVRTIAPPAEP